ncbi:MAG: hypothetical protein WAM85_01110 [Terracidiphilus sp.]
MTTVREILEASGVDTYEINSINPQVMGALEGVLSKAEQDRVSVNEFWKNTYNPGIAAWEAEKGDLARKLAQAEAQKAALLAERTALAESGIVGAELPINTGQSRNSTGQYATPGTPTFDPNDVVSRASQGLAAIADADWKHRQLYGQPLPISPSELVRQADAQGISPMDYASRQFKFQQKEQEIHDSKIRAEVEEKVRREFSERNGANPDVAQPRGSSRFADVQRAMKAGELKDPLTLSPEQRRAQALASIHRHVEERERRDA